MIDHTISLPEERVLILDFGSQYTQLIARRIRELKVYAEIVPFNQTMKEIMGFKPSAIILSGGPSSIYEKGAPGVDKKVFDLGVPILGICYGLCLIVDSFKGKVGGAESREYGRANLSINRQSRLFKSINKNEVVWMSHGDKILSLPHGFKAIGSSENADFAAIENVKSNIYGVQFHPEVHHTKNGEKILKNFLFEICRLKPSWSMKSFIKSSIESIREEVKDGTVLLGLSGGVDSSVTAALLHEALGEKLYCVFVNNGVLRKDEHRQVIDRFKKHMKLNLIYADESKLFLDKLKGIENPEKKRRIIGREFINVFMKEAKKIGKFDFLAQGTLYPDVIESVSTKGPSDTIKSHHNRVPEVMKIIIDDITLNPGRQEEEIAEHLSDIYNLNISNFTIIRKSLDARKKSSIVYRYRVMIDVPDDTGIILLKNKNISEYSEKKFPSTEKITGKKDVLITGAGPAGLFCALRLIEAGVRVKIIERGKAVDERLADIKILENDNKLNTESNILFGEGGAGTYSDGKLTTRISKPEVEWFYSRLVDMGAPSSILYESRPHLGTEKVRDVVREIRKRIKTSGSEILFNERVDDILINDGAAAGVITSGGKEYSASDIVLATGHSARDIYQLLYNRNIMMEKKGFAVGIRIEHPAELINSIQYGNSEYRGILPAADYFLTFKNRESGRGVYSFCMCPGGYIINSSSEKEMLCLNGMSFSRRDSEFSNSAIVVTVSPDDVGGNILEGLSFQREIEAAAYSSGGKNFTAPSQRITSFLNGKLDTGLPTASYAGGLNRVMTESYLPGWITGEIKTALKDFDRKMRGFITEEGIIIGPETRTSSPLRITRGKDFQSVNIKGLYPVGEGAGYAGGIVSSAVDGIRAADSIIKSFND